jgi:putative phosphoesterase
VRVAALYDIHGMLDALDAVLHELGRERVDAVVVGGDVVGGPQPAETLERLRSLDLPQHWIRGNGDRALAPGADGVTGATDDVLEYTAQHLSPQDAAELAALPASVSLEVDGLGRVLFCHATPRSDMELITPATPDEYLARAAAGAEERVIVCGHTHMQLDRTIDGVRWINAGSVGMPFEGDVAAFWAVLGPEVEFRRTAIDVERAAAEILATGWPDAPAFVDENLRRAVTREEAIETFERIAQERGER